MKVQPRHQLLQIWRGVVDESFGGGQWRWGGRDGRNSISDAEQLLCILAPATSVSSFGLDEPDSTSEDVAAALSGLGTRVDIPVKLLRAVDEYLTAYTEPDGTPVFSGEGYFSPPTLRNGNGPGELTPELRARQVVDSYVMSINLSLATIGFVRQFRRSIPRDQALLDEISRTEQLASRRLTAAMVALLRSFTVWVFDPDSRDGQSLTRTVNQTGLPDEQVQRLFRSQLADVRAGLRDLTIGIAPKVAADLLRPNKMFECGWSWSVVRESPPIPTADDIGRQDDGLAEEGAYIYFTVVALDGIAELFSERTRQLGLLDDEQSRLASALRIRWDLTQRYWATIATFGAGGPRRWPVEDMPWRTVDRYESDFFTLLVTSISARDLGGRRDIDIDLARLAGVLAELAERSRITRRAFETDQAVLVHHPGVSIVLEGTEEFGPQLKWVATDFAPLLLKRVVSTAGLTSDLRLRGQLLGLADDIWEHIETRRIEDGPARSLWDQPARVFQKFSDRFDRPSWHHTLRVAESLTLAARLVATHPPRSEQLADFAYDLLAEAEHLFDQELLLAPERADLPLRAKLELNRDRLRRCREIVTDRPASATALVFDVLRDLDQLSAARQNPPGAV
jgi:hypothetical protein